MSFERINDLKNEVYHQRAAVLVYHFSPNELKQLQNVARLTGIKEMIKVEAVQTQTVLKDLLDGEIKTSEESSIKAKTMVFNNIPYARMNAFIEALKKCRINRPLIATVTETSINWTFEQLLVNLIEEHRAVQNNQNFTH